MWKDMQCEHQSQILRAYNTPALHMPANAMSGDVI